MEQSRLFRRAHNPKVVGSNPSPATALVVQLVRMPPCHGGGRGFESRPATGCDGSVAQSVEQRTENPRVAGSIPAPEPPFKT